jgi:hypothetical protein
MRFIGGSSSHFRGAGPRLSADRVTYSGIGYLQPLRLPLGISLMYNDIVSALGKFVLQAVEVVDGIREHVDS